MSDIPSMNGLFAYVGPFVILNNSAEHIVTAYEDLYNPSTSLNPTNVRALPLVFIVLALAVRLAPADWAGDEQTRKLSSLRMYWSGELTSIFSTFGY